MLRRAEEGGLKPGGTIVEATSGNTGASLAMLAAMRGYKCVFVMPDKMSQEKISAPARVRRARRRLPDRRRARGSAQLLPGRAAHRATRRPTASTRTSTTTPPTPRRTTSRPGPRSGSRRAASSTSSSPGMGTGGTISGAGSSSRRRSRRLKIVGVDPVGSLYYDFVKTGRITKPFSYKVEGIGEDFFPTTMNLKILDDIVRVDDKECFLMTRDLTRLEGLFVGGSGGAAVAGAIKYARAMVEQGTAAAGDRPARILVFLARRGAQVHLEDLQRRLDARERLPRGRAGPRHRARRPRRTRRSARSSRRRRRRRCATSSRR